MTTVKETNQTQSDTQTHIGMWLCIGGAAIGAVGLIGWISGTPWPLTFVPGLPHMMPNTALALVLIGSAGAVRQKREVGAARLALSILVALAALAISVGTLAEYAFAIDLPILRIGQIFVSSQLAIPPGPSSPFSALALTFLGTAILLLNVRSTARVRPSELLVLCAALMVFTGLTGIILEAPPLFRLTSASVPVIGLSVPTAIGVLLISSGLLAGPARAGAMFLATSQGPGGILIRRLALPVLVVPILLALGVTQLFAVRHIVDVNVPVAIVAAFMTAITLFVLLITALPLNRAYDDVQTSRTRINQLVEHAPDGIFIANLNGRYTDVNDAGCRLLGYSREEILGKTIVDLIPASDVERLWQSKEALLQGSVQVAEWTLRRKDGSYIPVEVSAKILSDGRWQGFARDISERKRLQREKQVADEQLRESEERFRLAIDEAPIGMALVALDGRFSRVNRALCEIVGYSAEELTGLTFQAITHPDDLLADLALAARLVRGDIPRYQLENRYIRKDGGVVDIMLSASILRGRSGDALYYIAQVEDVTVRKHLAEELRLSEAKSTGILSISSDAIVSIDEDQRITQFNEGAEKTFGYSKTEVIGAPLEILIPERFRPGHRMHVARFAESPDVARKMGTRDAVIVGLRKNGDEFPADAVISKLEVGGRRVFTVAVRDVTEQKRVENEQRLLAEVGAVLATTLDREESASRVAEVVVRSFSDLCIVDVMVDGAGGTARLGVVSRDRSQDWICDALRLVPSDQKCPPLIESVLESRQPLVMRPPTPRDVEALAHDSDHLRALRAMNLQSLMVAPLIARGRLLGAITFLSATPFSAEANADLRTAQEIAHRTALGIDNAGLYLEAQRATQARDEVLGIVAHDLRNPLSVIVMETGLLAERGRGPERDLKRPQDQIRRAAMRMNRLIQDLLDVTRVEAGRLALEQSQISAAQVAAEAVEGQKALASSSSIELRLELSPELPELFADRERLLQVFENLIGNAIKFTPPGGSITVGASRQEASVLFWVRDTGPGIAPEDQPHLFDRFWQARTTKRGGAGLGLRIVKGIIEAHGGRVWVESAFGNGSTFFFEIPIPQVEERTLQNVAAGSNAAS